MIMLRDYRLHTFTFSYESEVVTYDAYGEATPTGKYAYQYGEWRCIARNVEIANILFHERHKYVGRNVKVSSVAEHRIDHINLSYTE